MYKNKKIAVVIPAFNEEQQISRVLDTMHSCVDCIIVVNDASTDNTAAVVELKMQNDPKIILLRHDINQSVGGAVATGYKWARDHDFDAVAVMDGDGQMDPRCLPTLLDPVVNDEADYVKANRLAFVDSKQLIPRMRFWGNVVLSLVTKIVSGYWHINDSQAGYKVINLKALQTIDWDHLYKNYGYPNDLLVRLNLHDFRVRDIPIRALYNVGERSKLKVRKVILPLSFLLIKMFFWRMREKYIVRDFHPLVLFYAFGFVSLLMCLIFIIQFSILGLKQSLDSEITLIIALLFLVSGLLLLFFAMRFDQDINKKLR